jgi:tetratricopeptide (TPR) repeat protein
MIQNDEITYLFYFFIAARAEGSFTFPSLSLTADGQSYVSQPFTIRVTKQPVINPDIRVSIRAGKNKLYVGEQTTLILEAAQKPNTPSNPTNQGFSAAIGSIHESGDRNFSISHLFADKISREQKRINGEIYMAFQVPFSIIPISEGTFTLGPVPFEYEELTRGRTRDPVNDFFGGFFNSGIERVPRLIHSNTLTIQALPLPPPPPDFSGAVGTFTISSNVEPRNLAAGDAATLTITLRGSTRPGNVTDIRLPQLDDFEIFSPEVNTAVDTSGQGIRTRKTSKYLVIPREAGSRQIPPVSWVYFDPSAGSYKTIQTEPVTLEVRPGKQTARQQTRYLTQEEIRQVGSDIRYIKTPVRLTNQSTKPYQNPLFLLLYPLPAIFALFSFLYKTQSDQRRVDSARVLEKRAHGTAGRQLARLSKEMSSLTPATAASQLYDIFAQYATHRFGFAAAGKTLDELRAEFRERVGDPVIADSIVAFLEELDTIRFSPQASANESIASRITTAHSIIANLEKSPKSKRKTAIRAIAGTLLIFTAANNLQASDALIQQWFSQANTAYHNQSYDSARIYYEKVIDAGVHNSAVYFNLGNACYRTGKIGLAVMYFGKAGKLAPTDPDIQANILFVNKHLVDRPPIPERSFIDMLLWRLHNILTLKAQLWCIWSLLVVLSIMFAAWLYVSRNIRLWLAYTGSLCAAICILLCISASLKIYAAENRPYAVALEKSVDAFNQPDGSKVLFTVHEGTAFTIRSRNGAWCLVSLPNGVSGWVKACSLGEI